MNRVGKLNATFRLYTTYKRTFSVAQGATESGSQSHVPSVLNANLQQVDPEIFQLIEHEKNRQIRGIQLIPSEVRHFLYRIFTLLSIPVVEFYFSSSIRSYWFLSNQ